jgi:polygalacturonase
MNDDTEAFEQAIRQIEHLGFGRLIVTTGTYLIRPINLTSHMTMLLNADVRIMGVTDKDTWPLIPGAPSYGQGRDHPGPRHTSLIHGEHLQNVTIRGHGNSSVLDGQGAYWWKLRRQNLDQYTRGSLVEFMYSQDIAMYDLTMVSIVPSVLNAYSMVGAGEATMQP